MSTVNIKQSRLDLPIKNRTGNRMVNSHSKIGHKLCLENDQLNTGLSGFRKEIFFCIKCSSYVEKDWYVLSRHLSGFQMVTKLDCFILIKESKKHFSFVYKYQVIWRLSCFITI
jgi:hypothetical protein